MTVAVTPLSIRIVPDPLVPMRVMFVTVLPLAKMDGETALLKMGVSPLMAFVVALGDEGF